MLIWDKYSNEYYEVIPVKKIEEKIDSLDNCLIAYSNTSEIDILSRISYAKRILQQLIKENTESEE